MLNTQQLQNLTRPQLDAVFQALGQTLTITRPSTPGDDGPPPDIGPDGMPLPGGGTGPPEQAISVRGFAYQLPAQEAAKLGAQIGVPLWNVLLPWNAPVETPGFRITLADGQLLEPTGDAENIGEQLVAWQVVCRVPGAR